MATITGLTAARMLEIEAASIVDGDVVGGDLILQRQDGTPINAGNVEGPQGPVGPPGAGGIMAGVVLDYAGNTPPAGYLLCDGASYLRADHPDLFAAIGVLWGSVDGTHFNVPDFRKRAAVGFDSGDVDFNAVGKTGGAKTHALTVNELAVHTHGLNDPGHTHTLKTSFDQTSGGIATQRSQWTSGNGHETNTTNGAGTGISVQNAGAGVAHNNMSPFGTVKKIIKT